ncbi:MAG: P-II family nitrogen regulator [Treponema sp.]|jgi:nitrogen regulatory protein PII|nr:P-II family nitrogen regulator [Treponema sp.]
MPKTLFKKLLSRLPVKLSAPQSAVPKERQKSETPKLKFIFFIADWHQANVISDVFTEEKVRFHFVSKGRGTASSEVLDLLGIGAGEKAVVTCLEQAVLIPVLLKEVRRKLKRSTPGAGIAFTVPLSAINDPVLLIFKQSILKNEKIAAEGNIPKPEPEKKGENMKIEYSHDLIVSIINHGFSDDFMNTAREAGATGGTVMNARGQAHQGAVKFFGVSVQDEKEIILILTTREKKVAIMQAVSEAHGLNSEAQGIIFALPVDSVLGLNLE